jgi:hypothetical protein
MENVHELRPGCAGLDLIVGEYLPVPAGHLRRLLEVEAQAQRAVAKVEHLERLGYGRIKLGAFDGLRAALAPNEED